MRNRLQVILLLLSHLHIAGDGYNREAVQAIENRRRVTFRARGSTTLYPMVKRVGKLFMPLYPKVSIQVSRSANGISIQKRIAEAPEIATSAHDPKEREFDSAKENGIHFSSQWSR